MACPLETSPPKENTTTRLRRLDQALELNTNSAGLGGTVFTPVPNAEHVLQTPHLLSLLSWSEQTWICFVGASVLLLSSAELGRSNWHPVRGNYHITSEGSCGFKAHPWRVRSLEDLEQSPKSHRRAWPAPGVWMGPQCRGHRAVSEMFYGY